jgi:D-3-phosphoglycerate dehydrogenase
MDVETTTVLCLSPWTEARVRELAGSGGVRVVTVPPPPAPDAIRAAIGDADIVIGDGRHKHALDADTLALARRCRFIQQPAAGFDSIDAEAAARLGIPVANAGGFNREAVADWVVMAILNIVRHGARLDRDMRAGGWAQGRWIGRELSALTVGIVGLGNVGQAVAARLRGFGTRMLANDIVPRTADGVEPASLDDVLTRADVVTLHVPLNATTCRLVGAQELARMRPAAILVNASRGPVVDETALVDALERGVIAGAALDVFEQEPLAADSPLRRMDNVFLTPHVGGGTAEARVRSGEVVATNLRRVLAGEPPLHIVNGVSVPVR